jgi:hypothetical protein
VGPFILQEKYMGKRKPQDYIRKDNCRNCHGKLFNIDSLFCSKKCCEVHKEKFYLELEEEDNLPPNLAFHAKISERNEGYYLWLSEQRKYINREEYQETQKMIGMVIARRIINGTLF